MDTIYREMLSVAMAQLHDVNHETALILFLSRRCKQLEAELSRYTAAMVKNENPRRV